MYTYTETLGEHDGIYIDHQAGQDHAVSHQGRGRLVSKPKRWCCYYTTDPG